LLTGANLSKVGENALKETLIKLENSHAAKKFIVATGYGRVKAPFALVR